MYINILAIVLSLDIPVFLMYCYIDIGGQPFPCSGYKLHSFMGTIYHNHCVKLSCSYYVHKRQTVNTGCILIIIISFKTMIKLFTVTIKNDVILTYHCLIKMYTGLPLVI